MGVFWAPIETAFYRRNIQCCISLYIFLLLSNILILKRVGTEFLTFITILHYITPYYIYILQLTLLQTSIDIGNPPNLEIISRGNRWISISLDLYPREKESPQLGCRWLKTSWLGDLKEPYFKFGNLYPPTKQFNGKSSMSKIDIIFPFKPPYFPGLLRHVWFPKRKNPEEGLAELSLSALRCPLPSCAVGRGGLRRLGRRMWGWGKFSLGKPSWVKAGWWGFF